MGQAQWKLENLKCMMPVPLPVMPDSMLEAIVIESSKLGTIILGNHQHVLHGNLGTTKGGRIIFSFYLAQALLDRAPNRFGSSSAAGWLPETS